MNNIEELNHSKKSLDTGKFYLSNGWGIIGFKSEVEFINNRNAIKFPKTVFGDEGSSNLIKELNEAITPILKKYSDLCKQEMKNQINGN